MVGEDENKRKNGDKEGCHPAQMTILLPEEEKETGKNNDDGVARPWTSLLSVSDSWVNDHGETQVGPRPPVVYGKTGPKQNGGENIAHRRPLKNQTPNLPEERAEQLCPCWQNDHV